MKIAVCMKQVEYIHSVTGDDPARNFIGRADRVELNNPADEAALARAVALRRKLKCDIWVFSLTERLIVREAARALALGAQRFIRLWDDDWRDLDARGVARVLAVAVKEASADLVLCGARSLDLMRGEVPVFLAAQLGLPLVCDVLELEQSGTSGALLLKKNLGMGDRLVLEARPPMVIGIDSAAPGPGYPSHVARLKVRPKEIAHWDSHRLGLRPNELPSISSLDSQTSPRPLPKTIDLLDGDLPATERIRWLLAGKGGAKEAPVLQGTAAELAERLAGFLRDGGFIKDQPSPGGK